MKSFTKYFKVILCFMAFAIVSFLFAFAPTMSSYASLNRVQASYNMAIKAVKMPRSTVEDENGKQVLRVPFLNSQWNNGASEKANYTIRVIDPSHTIHDYKVDESAGEPTETEYFKLYTDASGAKYLSISALNNGKYDVMYIMHEGEKNYYSSTYSVTVENVSYSLDLTIREGEKKGLKVLVPEKVAKSNDASAKIELPTASVKNEKTDAYLTDPVEVKVFNDNGHQLDLNNTEDAKILKLDNGTYYLYPTKTGKYTVEYTYTNGSDPLKKSITIEVADDFTAPTSADLSFANIPTMPSVELGQKDIKLPTVVLNSRDKDNVEFNITSIEISKGSISRKLTNNELTFDMTKEWFNQDSYTSAMIGDWFVKYTVEDAYGNTKSIQVTLDDVKDSTSPEVFMAYDYDLTTDNVPVDATAIDTSITTELKPEYGYNELYFPAIYATDAVTEYKDFRFVRYIQNTRTSKIYYLDNVMIKDGELYTIKSTDTDLASQMNASGDENIGKWNKAVKFTFNVEGDTEEEKAAEMSKLAGEYTMGYYVLAKDVTKQSNYLYSANTTMYKINILSTGLREISSDVKHTVEINNIKNNNSIESDGSLTVNISASETERKNQHGDTTEADKRLKNAVFYYYDTSVSDLQTVIENAFNTVKTSRTHDGIVYYGNCHIIDSVEFKNAVETTTGTIKFATLKNKNNYEIELNAPNGASKVYIVAISVDDDGNIALAQKALNIKDMSDETAPAWEISNAHSFNTENLSVVQGEEVELPDVKFTDTDKTLNLHVQYYVNDPNNSITGLDYQTPIGKNYKNLNDGSYIYGGKIKTTNVGTYTVVYTATDDAGNITCVYFTFEVTAKESAIFEVSATGENIKDNKTDTTSGSMTISGEIGLRVDFDPVLWSNDRTQNFTDDTDTVIDYTVKADKDSETSLDWELGDDKYSFIFNDPGTYYVTFNASRTGMEVEHAERTITVNVTCPSIEWNETLNESDYSYAPKGSVVTLPDLTASQGNIKANVELKVTFSGGDPELTKVIKNGTTVWQFTTNSTLTGDYKVEYTATTKYNSIKKTFNIKVGDNVPPTISMDHVDELGQDIVYDGKTNIEYKINLVKTSTSTRERKLEIVITNGKDVRTYNTNLVITDRDENGVDKTLTWDTLTVELLNGDTTMSTSSSDTYSKTYTISATGDYKLVIKSTDANTNTATKEIKFTVKTETDVDKETDTVVGVVLIILSLVVLAGVILFFALTGRKGGSNKAKLNKQPKAKTTKVEETTSSNEEVVEAKEVEDTDAKSGDVE